ncbi:MAG: carbon-nitrogen hydrolase family protein [Planctomycetaceae bacterium]
MSRREFIAATGMCVISTGLPLVAMEKKPRRVTLAQILVGNDVSRNLGRILTAIEQAEHDNADWVFFPEGALSGYGGHFDQSEVSACFQRICERCAQAKLNGLIGTCWKEDEGKPHNEIRIVDRSGKMVGQYSKTCLTYSDAEQFSVGNYPLVHEVDGIKIGTLICNDLWVTPGYTDGPNPHLTLKQARAGAQVIFHAVNSGANQIYRAYHESNQILRAAEAKCPIVTVNAAVETGEVNCTSGVILPTMEYSHTLSRKGEVIATIEFTPRNQSS